MSRSAPLDVRTARPDDADAMGACLVDAWLDAHRGQLPDALWEQRRVEWTPDVSAAGWRRLLADIEQTPGHPSTVMVATTAGAIAGIGMMTRTPRKTRARLDALYVHPNLQRRGVGRTLLHHLASALSVHEVETVDVSVLETNAPARRFYERLGAAYVGAGTFDEDGVSLPTAVYRWALEQLLVS